MAAGNKPTLVHFSLVAFVMLSMILGILLFVKWRESGTARTELAAAQKKYDDEKRNSDTLLAEVTDLSEFIGTAFTEVGGPGTNDANTVYGALLETNGRVPEAQRGPTIIASITNMINAIGNNNDEIGTLKTSLETNEQSLLALESNKNLEVEQHRNSAQSSEDQLVALTNNHDEMLAQKDQIISQKDADYRVLQSEHTNLRDELERVQSESEARISLLERQIDILNYHVAERVREALRGANVPPNIVDFVFDEVELVLRDRFDKPDGTIVNVDNDTRTVWIDLGHLDALSPQVSFSVYTRDHRGVGRSDRDIKAKVEVTRILEGHLAEARIIEEDLFRPISAGDPIFSPLWTAGRTEYFAFVGRLDLTEDGYSDLELLREVVRNAGAKIDLYVTEDGVREPLDAKLSARTKYLVIGDIDDPTDYSGQADKQQIIRDILAEQQALIDEAKLYGVQVVRLNDFLEYIGFKPQSRLWQPGEDRPFSLKAGAASAAVDEVAGDRSSSGQVSEVFRRNRAGVQRESSGTTSGLFRGK